MIFALLFMGIAAVSMWLDVKTTIESNALGIGEANPRYQNEDGSANVGKLVLDKFLLFGISAIASFVLYFSGLDFAPFPREIAFALFLGVALRHFIVWRHNAKNIRIRKEKLEREKV